MAKQIGWSVSKAIGGKYAVVYLWEGDIKGNGIIVFDTEDEAWAFIKSGQADRLGRRL